MTLTKTILRQKQWLARSVASHVNQPTAAAASAASLSTGQSRNLATTPSTSNTAATNSKTSSVSSEEVTKFSGMDEKWWDPQYHPLVAMNPVRIGYLLDMVKRNRPDGVLSSGEGSQSPPLKELKALDVGCGGGLLSESLARLGATVTAVDPSQALVDAAKEHAKSTGDPRIQNIDYRGGISVEELAEDSSLSTDNKYDIVTLLEVLEHASDVTSLVQSASSLLKDDGGIMFVSTINRTWKSYLLTIVGAEYVMGYIPKGTHDWNQYLSPEEVTQVMEKCGMERIDTSGMVLRKPPLFGNWDWRIDPNDTDVNWIGAFRKKKMS